MQTENFLFSVMREVRDSTFHYLVREEACRLAQ